MDHVFTKTKAVRVRHFSFETANFANQTYAFVSSGELSDWTARSVPF